MAASGYGTIPRHQGGGGIHVPGSKWRNALFETGRSADSNIRKTINKKNMTKLEKAAERCAALTENQTFGDDPYDCKKQLAANMTWEAFIIGGGWMLENAIRWLNANAKNFSDNADELIKQFDEAMGE